MGDAVHANTALLSGLIGVEVALGLKLDVGEVSLSGRSSRCSSSCISASEIVSNVLKETSSPLESNSLNEVQGRGVLSLITLLHAALASLMTSAIESALK